MRIQQNYAIQNSYNKIGLINFKQNNSSKDYNTVSLNQAKKMADEHNKRSSRNILLSSVLGTAIGTAIGVLTSKKKVKSGLIGGSIGLISGCLVGCMTNTHVSTL